MLSSLTAQVFVFGFFAAYVIAVIFLLRWIYRTRLRRNRAKIRQIVSKWTGEYQLTLDSVFDDMIGRCRELKLRAVGSERQLRMEFIVLLTAKTVHSLYSPSRRQWLAL